MRAVKDYASDWQQYAYIFFREAQANFKSLLEGQKVAEMHADQRYQSLFEENMKINQTMQTMAKEIEHMREQRKQKEKSKEDRKNAKKQPLRESISEEEFYIILELIKHKGFVP